MPHGRPSTTSWPATTRAILGLVLSGSAARGMATERSDVDVYVVRADSAGLETSRSPAIDEIPISLDELEEVPPYGSSGWFFRWSFAYAQVLRDEAGGRVTAAVRRQAVLDDREQRSMLIDHDRLDGWLNFAYRSLKSHRDGRDARVAARRRRVGAVADGRPCSRWPAGSGPTTSTSRGS